MNALKKFIENNCNVYDLINIHLGNTCIMRNQFPHEIALFYNFYQIKEVRCEIVKGIKVWDIYLRG